MTTRTRNKEQEFAMAPANMLLNTGRQVMGAGLGIAAVGVGLGVAGFALHAL